MIQQNIKPVRSCCEISEPSLMEQWLLLKLLMRLWDVKQGQVLVSGRKVEDINTSDLRNMEGFVTQDTVLFHDTIANNIAVGKLNATREEIMDAAIAEDIRWFLVVPGAGRRLSAEKLAV